MSTTMQWTLSAPHMENVVGTYEGDILENKPHGNGTFETNLGSYYANRVSYRGEWKDGHCHGSGVLKEIFPNKYVSYTYEGAFMNGSFHGQGEHTILTNTEYEDYKRDEQVHYEVITGEWKNGCKTNGSCLSDSFVLQYYRDEDIIDLIECGYIQHRMKYVSLL